MSSPTSTVELSTSCPQLNIYSLSPSCSPPFQRTPGRRRDQDEEARRRPGLIRWISCSPRITGPALITLQPSTLYVQSQAPRRPRGARGPSKLRASRRVSPVYFGLGMKSRASKSRASRRPSKSRAKTAAQQEPCRTNAERCKNHAKRTRHETCWR